ncbi:MAG: ATP synthase F1 subunit delta [Clostridia bacterium]|nr:ATP synthase F1 subunit delta [Clostridia bacterium]
MNEISKEYGSALFLIACEVGKEEAYLEALQVVEDAFRDAPELGALLGSPNIPVRERLEVIDTVFGERLPEHVLSYLKLLCEKGRIPQLCESILAYRELYDAAKHQVLATVTSAVPLTEEEKEKLIQKLETLSSGRVQAEYRIDKALLGGFVVEMDGRVLDGSLRHHLHKIKGVIHS